MFGVSTNGAKPTDTEILEEICGIKNAILNGNDHDYDEEDWCGANTSEYEGNYQAIGILTKLNLYYEIGKDIRAVVRI